LAFAQYQKTAGKGLPAIRKLTRFGAARENLMVVPLGEVRRLGSRKLRGGLGGGFPVPLQIVNETRQALLEVVTGTEPQLRLGTGDIN
jgi:hypothetical protein